MIVNVRRSFQLPTNPVAKSTAARYEQGDAAQGGGIFLRMQDIGMDAWVEGELGGCDLVDRRLSRRLGRATAYCCRLRRSGASFPAPAPARYDLNSNSILRPGYGRGCWPAAPVTSTSANPCVPCGAKSTYRRASHDPCALTCLLSTFTFLPAPWLTPRREERQDD